MNIIIVDDDPFVTGALKTILESMGEITVKATDGVRYTVPKTIHVGRMEEELTLRFRVGAVFKNPYISLYLNDQRAIHRKRPIMAPGEMESLQLTRKQLEEFDDLKEITVRIEEE